MMSNAMNTAPAPHSLGSGMAPLREHAGWIVVFGIALIVFGVIALGNVVAATAVTVFYVGIMMLLGAIAEIVMAFRAQTWGKFFFWLALGVLYGIAGVITIDDWDLAATVLTLMLGAVLVATGLVRIYLAFQIKEGTPWFWAAASGAITTLVGLIILSRWPTSSVYTLGIFLGVDLLFAGVSWVNIGLALKSRRPAA
jgi:uncharacterized membrane protein HdeD (DUF308 family)